MNALIDRLKEPSTYAGLSAMALAVGVSADQMTIWVGAVAGLFAFVSIIVKEVGGK